MLHVIEDFYLFRTAKAYTTGRITQRAGSRFTVQGARDYRSPLIAFGETVELALDAMPMDERIQALQKAFSELKCIRAASRGRH